MPPCTVRFISGYTRIQFHILALCARFFVWMCIGIPIAAFFLAPGRELVLLLVTGVAFVCPLLRMLHFNSPGSYDPRKVPSELVP
jgi:hypothetical protein